MRKLFFEYCWHEHNELKEITHDQLLFETRHYKWDDCLLLNVNMTIHTNGIIEMFYEKPKIICINNGENINNFLEKHGKELTKKDLKDIVKDKVGLFYKIIKDPIYENLFQVPLKMWYQYLFKKWNRYIEVFESTKYCHFIYFITTEKKKEHVLYKDWKTVKPLNNK